MLSLDLSNEPRWHDLAPGVRVQLRPLTTALMVATRSDPEVGSVPEEASDEERAVAFARALARRAVLKWDPGREKSIVGYRVYRIDGRTVTRLTPDLIEETTFTISGTPHARFAVAAIDVLGQEGQPSSPAWCGQSFRGFFKGPWHQ